MALVIIDTDGRITDLAASLAPGGISGDVQTNDGAGGFAGVTLLGAAHGGTHLDCSAAANGKLLIGNGSGFTLATLTAGSNVTITNGAGTITIAASGGGGSPGGADTNVQYDDGGSFGGNSGFTHNKTSKATVVTDGTYSATLCQGTYAGYFFQGSVVAGLGGSVAGQFTDGTRNVTLCNGSIAGHFTDGARTVDVCDGTNNVTYTPGNAGNWSGSPTDVWVALDRIAAAVAGLLSGTIP